MPLTVVLNWRVPLRKLWVCLPPHTCTIQHEDNHSFILSVLDAIVRPPCENNQVNDLINELLVHVGLIKVNCLIFKIFLGTKLGDY